MSEVFIHIGPPKTASTYLQKGVWNNREYLREQGLLYPADHDHEFIVAANDVLDGRFMPVNAGGGPGVWDKVAGRARGWPGTALISCELLAFCEPEHIKRVVESLAPASLRLIVMARCRADMLPSLYQERVKMVTVKESFEDFLTEFCQESNTWPMAPGLLVERWLPFIGRENIHVVTVPRAMADPRLLIERFGEVLGIDPSQLGAGEQKLNPSLDAVGVALMRAVTERTAGRLDQPAQKALIAGRLVPLLRSLDLPRRPLRLPGSMRPLMAEIGAGDQAALAAAGCHIHGDLADLLPQDSAFADGTCGHGQTAGSTVSDADVLAVAVDMLVAAVSGAEPG